MVGQAYLLLQRGFSAGSELNGIDRSASGWLSSFREGGCFFIVSGFFSGEMVEWLVVLEFSMLLLLLFAS